MPIYKIKITSGIFYSLFVWEEAHSSHQTVDKPTHRKNADKSSDTRLK